MRISVRFAAAIVVAAAWSRSPWPQPRAPRPCGCAGPDSIQTPARPGSRPPYYSPQLKKLGVAHPKPVAHPKIDCFYVYPTVSDQKTTISNLHIDPGGAVDRALPGRALFAVLPGVRAHVPADHGSGARVGQPRRRRRSCELPLSDVRRAFTTYLQQLQPWPRFRAHRPLAGLVPARELIAKDIDPHAALRRRLVSAILLGGNVLVKRGTTSAGTSSTFRPAPAPPSSAVSIAFSTFDRRRRRQLLRADHGSRATRCCA